MKGAEQWAGFLGPGKNPAHCSEPERAGIAGGVEGAHFGARQNVPPQKGVSVGPRPDA